MHIETVRYYERIGLVPPPPRTPAGRRLYNLSHVNRFSFIRHSRKLGFDVATIKSLLALQSAPDSSCAEVTRIAKHQLAEVEGRLEALVAMRDELRWMIKTCGNRQMAACRIVRKLTSTTAEKAASP